MSVRSPIVPPSMVRALLERPGLDPHLLRDAVRSVGLSPELTQRGIRITQERFTRLYQEIALRLDDEMPGMFSRPLRSGSTKFLCRALVDAPSVHVALHRALRFAHLMLDDFMIRLQRDGHAAHVSIHPRSSVLRRHALGQQMLLKLLHGLVGWLAGREVALLQVQFAFPRAAFALAHVFPDTVRFECPVSALSFDAEVLALPVRRGRRDIDAFVGQAPASWLFGSLRDVPLRERIRHHLAARLQAGAGVGEVARGLHLSVRTLCRRLDAEGTSFQAIKDELRRELAIERLIHTRTPVAAIATELGFGDPNSFYRAFRSWSGVTPGAFRQAAGSGIARPSAADAATTIADSASAAPAI